LKKSFSLLYTIIFLIIMAVVGMMIMQFSASSTKHTARSFMDTKAELIARSATEFAIMAMQGHNYTNGKINKINLTYPGFNVEIRFHYFSTDCANTTAHCSKIDTADTNMSSLIYVIVTSKNPALHIRKVYTTIQNP